MLVLHIAHRRNRPDKVLERDRREGVQVGDVQTEKRSVNKAHVSKIKPGQIACGVRSSAWCPFPGEGRLFSSGGGNTLNNTETKSDLSRPVRCGRAENFDNAKRKSCKNSEGNIILRLGNFDSVNNNIYQQ